jgi:SET domain-containing protein
MVESSPDALAQPIEVRRSDVHGLGVFAACDLKAGTVIGAYAGRRLSPEDVERMQWDEELTYLFGLSDGSVIDGSVGGNATRHLNHACEPNCEAVEFYDDDGQLAVRIETIRTVRAGEELFLDYSLVIDDSEDPRDYPCRCGTRGCRGTLVAPSGS